MTQQLNNNDFEFTYSAPTTAERREIENIKKNYIPQTKTELALEKLRKLDSRVKNIPVSLSLVFGVIGTLIFGLGLTMVLEWNLLLWGIIVMVVGLVPVVFAYPLFKKVTAKLKEKYSPEIIKLSDELLNNGKTNEN